MLSLVLHPEGKSFSFVSFFFSFVRKFLLAVCVCVSECCASANVCTRGPRYKKIHPQTVLTLFLSRY